MVSDNPNPASVRAKVGAHHRTISTHLNTLTNAGLILERVTESRQEGIELESRPDLMPAPLALIVSRRTR